MPVQRVVTEEVFRDFIKELFEMMRSESQKVMANAEEGLRTLGAKNEKLAFYFKGHKGGVQIFMENFWERLEQEATGQSPFSHTNYGL